MRVSCGLETSCLTNLPVMRVFSPGFVVTDHHTRASGSLA